MKVHFGPNVSCQIKSALHYATIFSKTPIDDHTIHWYDEDDSTLFTFIENGTVSLNGVTVHVDKTDKVHALETCLVQEIYGYLEADNLETIQNFLETSTEYTRNMVSTNKTKDKLKVLNFDYKWECDCLIKKKSYSSIHLPAKILQDFKTDIETFFSPETKKRYEELELTPSRIYALYGPPGTGKTTLIHTTASHYSMSIGTLSFDNNMNDRMFKTALKKIPANTVLCLEDVDCLFREDRKTTDSCITFSGIINALDGICKIKNVIIFLTTNHLERLDSALKRRIDYFVKFDYCTKDQVSEMFTRFLPTEDFDIFWPQCSKLKLTPSILQKFFICNIHKKFEDYYKNIKNFTESEHGLEKLPDMYT